VICGESDDAVCGLDAAVTSVSRRRSCTFRLENLGAGARRQTSNSTKRWSRTEFEHIIVGEQIWNALDSIKVDQDRPWGFPQAASAKGKYDDP
jgi:hypothetical protein